MKTYQYIILTLIAILFGGCEGMLDITNPNQPTDQTFWRTEADFRAAMTSCYSPLKVWSGGYYGTRGLMIRISRADDIEFRNDIAAIYAIHRFTNDPNNSVAQNVFYQFYNAIHRTNTILQKIEEKDFPTEFKQNIRGEALFIRGLYYFQIAREFGDVPLRLKASQDPETFPMAKSPQSEIYAQAEKDFIEAAKLLPIKNKVGRPTKGAATAFLGKLYVYQENWQAAKSTLEPLTKSPYQYELVEDFAWNFDEAHENNAESIFEILYDPAGGSNQWDNGETANSAQSTTIAVEYAAGEVGGWFEAKATKKMMDIFLKEKAANGGYDYRALTSVAWNYPGCVYYQKPFQEVFKNNNDGLNSYWIIKYSNSATRTQEVETLPSYINERAMRYADVILLLAECELNLGNTSAAISYIDQIRTRGGNLAPYSGSTDSDSVKAELIHQRAIEFFKEGERFYDLRRWGLLEKELKAQDPLRFANFQKRNLYLPIPAKEIQNNLLCTQSEGW